MMLWALLMKFLLWFSAYCSRQLSGFPTSRHCQVIECQQMGCEWKRYMPLQIWNKTSHLFAFVNVSAFRACKWESILASYVSPIIQLINTFWWAMNKFLFFYQTKFVSILSITVCLCYIMCLLYWVEIYPYLLMKIGKSCSQSVHLFKKNK